MRKDKQAKLLQVLENNLGDTDYHYYQNLKRIHNLADVVERYTMPQDRLLNLGSGAFLLECVLEDRGYNQLTAVDIDNRLVHLNEQLSKTGLLRYTTFHKISITEYRSAHSFEFITIYDCVYYPKNNIVEMLRQLHELLSEGGHLLFDVYDKSVYERIKFFYDRVRPKYRNRTMYDLGQLNNALSENGFSIVEVNAELGSKEFFAKMILKTIYLVTRRALVVNYLVRKRCA